MSLDRIKLGLLFCCATTLYVEIAQPDCYQNKVSYCIVLCQGNEPSLLNLFFYAHRPAVLGCRCFCCKLLNWSRQEAGPLRSSTWPNMLYQVRNLCPNSILKHLHLAIHHGDSNLKPVPTDCKQPQQHHDLSLLHIYYMFQKII